MGAAVVIWRSSVVLIFGILLLVGLAALGYQTVVWAKTGEWIPLPLAQAFIFFSIDLSPVYHPRDWKGVAGVAAWLLDLPLFLAAPITGFLVCNVITLADPFGIEDRLYREELSASLRQTKTPAD